MAMRLMLLHMHGEFRRLESLVVLSIQVNNWNGEWQAPRALRKTVIGTPRSSNAPTVMSPEMPANSRNTVFSNYLRD
jgi:hypothetical protein